jgi:hypothetical protein
MYGFDESINQENTSSCDEWCNTWTYIEPNSQRQEQISVVTMQVDVRSAKSATVRIVSVLLLQHEASRRISCTR